MAKIPLSYTEDLKIVSVKNHGLGIEEICVTKKLDTRLFDYYKNAFREGFGHVDLRSRIARLGRDLEIIEGPDTDGLCKISFTAILSPFMDDYLLGTKEDNICYQGFEVSKYVAFDPNMRVSLPELKAKIEEGSVKLPKGSVVLPNGDIKIALQYQHKAAREMLIPHVIYDALHKYSRDKLILLQPRDKATPDIKVPAEAGVIASTTLRINNYSLEILIDQEDGVKHTMAHHVQPHSCSELVVELKGNGKHPVKQTHVLGRLYKNSLTESSSYISRPRQSISTDEMKWIRDKKSPDIFVFKETLKGLEMDSVYIPGDQDSLKEFQRNVIKFITRGEPIYFNKFPAEEYVNILASQARLVRPFSICFRDAPDIGTQAFDSRDYDNLVTLANAGVRVYWDHPQKGEKLVFYEEPFLAENDVKRYKRAKSSNSIVSYFGSAEVCSTDHEKAITSALEGIAKFTAGNGVLYTGGGPNKMSAAGEIAHDLGMLVLTMNLVKPNVKQSFFDGGVPFNDESIDRRQPSMIGPSSIYLTDEGGVGTGFELYQVLTAAKIERFYKPILVIAHEGTMTYKLARALDTGINIDKTVPGYINDRLHFCTGSQVYDALMNHFRFATPDQVLKVGR
ncbi:hypothetical protein K9M79_00690 [Candidatus Woesearchaeota archaeon]|nr:hypothetical protein [Candidatus Woesearchaeota archaeon]